MIKTPRRSRVTHDGAVTLGGWRYTMRTVSHGDVDELHAMDIRCFPPDRAFTAGYFHLLFHYDRAYGWALVSGGRIVAFILLTCNHKTVNVATIDVDPSCRRRGLGRFLMQYAEEDSVQRGARRITLQVDTANTGAIRLYHSLGFVKQRTLPAYYISSDAWLMSKELR